MSEDREALDPIAEDVAPLSGLLPEQDALDGQGSMVPAPPDAFARVAVLSHANVLSYVFSSNLTMVFAAAVGLITRKLLGPQFYGAFFFAVSIAGYLSVTTTPFDAMVDVEVPLIMGRGERDRVHTVLGGVYGL